MADVQVSEPQFGVAFSDRGWRAQGAGRTGILDDFDASAFGLTLPAEGNTIEIGSTTQPSRLVVDGYGLEIPKATTHSLPIPAPVSGGTTGRTDLIVARLNPSEFTGDPGPVRLYQIEGTEGSLTVPSGTYDPVGIRDLPLYRFRRRQGEGLNQAIVTDLRPRLGEVFDVPFGAPLPPRAPLASRATRGGVGYRMDSADGGIDWVEEWWERQVLTGTAVRAQNGEGFTVRDGSRLTRRGTSRFLNLVVGNTGSASNPNPAEDGEQRVAQLHDVDDPIGPHPIGLTGWGTSMDGERRAISGFIDTDGGWVTWHWASTNTRFSSTTGQRTIVLTGSWETE